MAITGLVHVNINCSDFQRSEEFYRLLGFERFMDVAPTTSPEVAAAVGLPPYRLRGALLVLRAARQPVVIDLLEWQSPRDERRPYESLNHLGIARIALATDDLDGEVARLKRHGVQFVSEPASVTLPGAASTSRFVCFFDPAGAVLELVESG